MHQVVLLEKEIDSGETKYTTQDSIFKKLIQQNEELEQALEKHGESSVLDYEPTQIAQE